MTIQIQDPCEALGRWEQPIDPRDKAFRWVLWTEVLTTPAAALTDTNFTLSAEAVADGVQILRSWIDATNNLAIAEISVVPAQQDAAHFQGDGKDYVVDCWMKDDQGQELTVSIAFTVKVK